MKICIVGYWYKQSSVLPALDSVLVTYLTPLDIMKGGYVVMIDCSSYNPWIIWSLKLQGLLRYIHRFLPWWRQLICTLRSNPSKQLYTANFSVNKTVQMKEYTEDFICKDDAVYCTILHFFRSTTSVWCTHNYRPCTVTKAQTIPVSITIMPIPLEPLRCII